MYDSFWRHAIDSKRGKYHCVNFGVVSHKSKIIVGFYEFLSFRQYNLWIKEITK